MNPDSPVDAVDEGPFGAWREGEVWFRDLIPTHLPWGREDLLDAVPEMATGSYGARTGEDAQVDGQRYGRGEVVPAASAEELLGLLPSLKEATDLVFPWYNRMVPVALLSPHRERIDLAAYRAEAGGRFVRALLVTGAALGLGYAFPNYSMLALLAATMYGLFPLVESAATWLQRIDRLPVPELNRRLVNFEFFRRWLLGRRSRLLMVGVGLMVAIFVGQTAVGLDPSIEAAALVKARVRNDGEWWRLVTTGLMHGHLLHILFNGMALYNLGRIVAALVSPSLLGVVFLFTVVTGSLASLWLGPGPASVGASGGILGCLGFLLVVTRKFRAELPGFLRTNLLQASLVVAIFGWLGSRFIDNAAHAGGFLGGILLGLVFSPWIRLAPPKARPAARVLSALSLAVLAAAAAKIAWELWRAAA